MRINVVDLAATGRSKSQLMHWFVVDESLKSLSVNHHSLDAIQRGLKTHR